MGYSYGYNERGRRVLSCDGCGNLGGVRKRTCPHKVLTDNSRSTERLSLSNCYPAALCADCYAKNKSTLHAGCAEDARQSQAEYDATQARLDAGDLILASGWGDWHEKVPAGFVGAMFVGAQYSRHTFVMIPEQQYQKKGRFLSDYPESEPWCGPDVVSKEVRLA